MTISVTTTHSSREFEGSLWAKTSIPIELDSEEVLLEAHAFRSEDQLDQVLVLLHRNSGIAPADTPVVRVHSGCATGDIFHSLRCDCYAQLQEALRVICKVPLGAIVYVPRHEGRGIGLFKKIQAYAMQDRGLDTVDANLAVGEPADARTYDLAAGALLKLGLKRIRLLSNNITKARELARLGIAVDEIVPIHTKPNRHNARYLKTKRDRMNHRI